MNPENLMTETAVVTQHTPTGTRDEYGNVLTAPVTRTTICYHEQIPTFRDESGGIATETWNLFLPTGDPLSATDSIEINGKSFEVIGDPWPTWNPRAQEFEQVEATIRRTDG